jgi:predicted XRE-type DNA-binding protein
MKADQYNNISASLKRMLKPDERAVYRVLSIRPDPDNAGKFLMPAALQIRPTDIIIDKHSPDQFVTIAAIERQENDGNPIFLNIVFTAANLGYLFLEGRNPVHQKIYQYLELCNYNESNENRNPDIEPVFMRVDSKKEAANERGLRKMIVKAVNTAIELEDAKANEVAMALGIEAASIEEVRNELEDYAEENPEEFLVIVERASLGAESVLKEAVKKGIIKNNVNSQLFEWVDTGKEIMKYKKAPNKNYFKELADYLEENNPDELNAIKTRLG